ncbi:MAG TPA: hypothetical protein VD978_07020 [Azospirillum sp.]|nr:hypothetical protein [Azospirillum sp.]
MPIEIGSSSASRPPAVPIGSAKAPMSNVPASPAGVAPPAVQVDLSPEAQALATLQAMNAAAKPVEEAAPSEEEQRARATFMEAVKQYFAQSLGIDKDKVASLEINDEALRYIVRNTVLGALAPPGLRKELGIDLANHAPKSEGKLAEVTLHAKNGPPLARIVFDGDALEELARLPKRKKDKDGDGMFSVLDLLPNTRTLEPGQPVKGGHRFDEADKRFAKSDDAAANAPGGPGIKRVTLSDDTAKPYFMARLRGDVEKADTAAAMLCFSLLQFAGYAPPR